jgi:hypothetical protein
MKVISVFAMLVVLSPSGLAQSRTARQSVRRPPVNASQTPADRAAGQSLPLHRVILYSNGVAYFERRGTVTGHAAVNLPFKESQVNDVLKSMVVLDLGKVE